MARYLIPVFLPVCLGSTSLQAANAYNITASAGLMLDDNITRASYSGDIYDDRALFAGLAAEFNLPAGERSRAVITGNAEIWQYQDAELGHKVLSLRGDYIFQPASGYTAPWYDLYLLFGLNFNDSRYRDGNFHEFGIDMGKRLTDRTRLRTGLNQHSLSADSGYHSTDTTRLYANLDFSFGNDTLYTTLAYSTGDLTVTVGDPYTWSPGGSHTGDDAFPWLDNAWAYKIDADAWSVQLGYVLALAANQSIDTSLQHYSASASGGTDYDGMIFLAAYFYRF